MSATMSATMELYGVPISFILPHILLPLSCIAALASPPFEGRGIIWASLITYCAYRTLVDEWPYDSQVRYSLRQGWFAYFPTITYLLFSDPEKALWRTDDQQSKEETKKEAVTNDQMSLIHHKLRRAAALWINPRGIGWNYELKNVPKSPYAHYSTRKFLLRQSVNLLWHLLILDGCLYILRNYLVPRDPDQIKYLSAFHWAAIQTLITTLTYATWYSPWFFVSMVAVATGLSQPKDWPPFFGSLRGCTTVGSYWGTYWHQVLRKPVLDWGRAIVTTFNIPRGSPPARIVYLLTSFVISGFFHAITFDNLKPYPASSYIYQNTMLFFVSQAFGIMLEAYAIKEYLRWEKSRGVKTTENGEVVKVQGLSDTTKRWIGYVWVWTWLFFSGRGYADMLLRTDMVWWKPPMPMLEWVFG